MHLLMYFYAKLEACNSGSNINQEVMQLSTALNSQYAVWRCKMDFKHTLIVLRLYPIVRTGEHDLTKNTELFLCVVLGSAH